MQKKRSIKIISVVLILVLICISVIYAKSDNSYVLATTSTFNTENLQDNEHMHVEIDSSGDKVPVPNGYVGSRANGENEIDTGYVIYEGEGEVNNENVGEAQKTRNQYVWIPVPDASTMYGTDSNGKKWGKLYEFTTDTGDNIDPVTGAKPLNWSENGGVMKIQNGWTYREPDISIIFDKDVNLKLINVYADKTHEFLNKLEQEFNSMIESIKKYGGFYIGRYETGNLSKEKSVVLKGNIDINNQKWDIMYNKCKNLKNNGTNVETGIIWGSQLDRTLIWLIESGNKTKEEICEDSTSWGNHKNAQFDYENTDGKIVTKTANSAIKIPTGSSEYTKANNIYDLVGNMNEYSMESATQNTRARRGGNYYANGDIANRFERETNDLYSKFEFLRLPCNAVHQIA